jgi:hypothetical protein
MVDRICKDNVALSIQGPMSSSIVRLEVSGSRLSATSRLNKRMAQLCAIKIISAYIII